MHSRLRARKDKQALPFASGQAGQRKQSFLLQAMLILLPVALMAGFGFWAILRQRNAVEQEAQRRAREILQALPSDFFGRIAANRLTQFEGPKTGWLNYLQWGIAAWPENKIRKQLLGDSNELQAISNNLAILRSAIPQWQFEPFPLVNFDLNTNGDLAFGRPTEPSPPAWLAAMSTGQQQAWWAFQRAACASEPLSSLDGLFKALQQTQPPASALTCAEFIQLRARLSSSSATNAINQLLRFRDRHDDVISESGLPLSTLVLAEALKRARECGPSEQLWDKLQSEVSSPSALTSILLDEAGRLVANNAQLSQAVKAMRIVLADKLAQFELAEALKQTGKLNGIATTNLWVDAGDQHWYCILGPSISESWTSISNHSVATVIPETSVICFPQFIVARGFSDAFKDAKISLPDYFGISLKLDDRAVPLPSPWGKSVDAKPTGDILADATFQMSQRAGMRLRDSDSGQEGLKAFLLAMPDSKQEGKDIFFEDMPGHPKFVVQIRLADRRLLYAKQRQLQFIFGALIGVSALTALIGFVAAYSAFRHQQQLGEMKSNFVSSVSHELRAPIASMRLLAESLQRGKVSGETKQKEYFGFLVQESRRLSSLIENILDFSRIEQGRKKYQFEPTDLDFLVEQTLKLMQPCAVERGVELKLQKAEAASQEVVCCDGLAVQQALINLIDNAIKHSPSGAAVAIGLQRGPESFRLWVEDGGAGIPREEHERIFERFYRRGSELRRETQGIGIGLSIVKHSVEAHGGRILLRSAVGQGSRFTMELPNQPAAAEKK